MNVAATAHEETTVLGESRRRCLSTSRVNARSVLIPSFGKQKRGSKIGLPGNEDMEDMGDITRVGEETRGGNAGGDEERNRF